MIDDFQHSDDASSVSSDTATDSANGAVSSDNNLRDQVAVIRELYRRRQDLLNAEGALSRQINRIVARTLQKPKPTVEEVKEHAPAVLMDMRMVPHKAKLAYERQITKMVEALPVWREWGAQVRGFGPLSMGAIIGEAGNLSDFDNPAKLWKFMGMALIDGERQRKCADKEKAIRHGYCPRRRSVMFVMGENLIRAGGDYKALYDARKVHEQQTVEASGVERSKMHIHLRAKRYIEKRLLRDLWRAWRDQEVAEFPLKAVEPSLSDSDS